MQLAKVVGNMVSTHKNQFNKRHKQPPDTSNSKAKIAKLSGISLSILNDVFDRGIGAYKTNPSSVRPQVTSAEQWAYARIYAFVNKIEKGSKLNHDLDLFNSISFYGVITIKLFRLQVCSSIQISIKHFNHIRIRSP